MALNPFAAAADTSLEDAYDPAVGAMRISVRPSDAAPKVEETQVADASGGLPWTNTSGWKKPTEDVPAPTATLAPRLKFDATPEERATLDQIRQRESGGRYDALFGGGRATDLTTFPQWSGAEGPAGTSHAAGAYQFQPATYAGIARETGATDFSPESQDINALALLRKHGPNSAASWQASGPYPQPQLQPVAQTVAQRDVPMPQPTAPQPAKPTGAGPFRTMTDAYEAAPAQRDAYTLQRSEQGYIWKPKASNPDPGVGPSQYYHPDNDKSLNAYTFTAPQTFSGQLKSLAWNFGSGFNQQIARVLDLPANVADLAISGVTAGLGMRPLSFKFGNPAEKLMNKLGIATEPSGEGWPTDVGHFAGAGAGSAVPFMGAAAGMARAGAGVGNSLVQSFARSPAATAANETALAAGSGATQGEAHNLYKGQTGRSGDLGDLATQFIAGGAMNLARVGVITAAEKIASTAASKAWEAGKTALSGKGAAGPGMEPPQVMDPATGRQVMDHTLQGQLAGNLKTAEQHVSALGTVDPADSVGHIAERSAAARDAVQAFARGTAAEERQLWSPEAGVNLQMPRNFSQTQALYRQLEHDHMEGTLRDPKSFPSELGALLSGKGGLSTVDTLGRGQDLRSRVGKMLDDELAVQGSAVDRAKVGYLTKIKDSLKADLESGTEGANPAEIDAYRRAMAFSASRAGIMNSPEMNAFMSDRTGDASAIDKLVRQGQPGADAVRTLVGAAQQKYGAEGLLGAAKDVLRQKYANMVAPSGYVSQADHKRFMQQYGGTLSDPAFADVRRQFETAASSEASVAEMLGKPGGYGKSGSASERRVDRAELYMQAPTDTVMSHLEGVSNKFGATRQVISQLEKDPTGEAVKGFQHVVADRVLHQPDWFSKHGGIVDAIDRINPGFKAAAQYFSSPTTGGGAVKQAMEFGLSYMGAKAGGKLASGGLGAPMVMAGRGAAMMRQVGQSVAENISQIKTATLVDPEFREAWGRYTAGTYSGGAQQRAADMLLMHAFVPGLAVANLPDPNQQSGQSTMGSSPNPAGPHQAPGGKPWFESLPGFAPGAGRM